MASQHFFKPLLPDFHSHLTIPVAFLKNIQGKHEVKLAKLRSDASKLNWEVKIDGNKFTDGWKEFALAHNLRTGDIVIFRQEQDMSSFHVTVFGLNRCEIQYEKIKVKKNPKREAESSSSLDPSCFSATVSPSSLRYNRLNLPSSFVKANGFGTRCGEIVLMNGKGKSWTLALKKSISNGTVYITRGWRSFCLANGLKAGDIFTFKLVRRGGALVLCLADKEGKQECSEANEVESLSLESESDEESSEEETIPCNFSRRKEKKPRLIWKASSSPFRNRLVTLILRPYNVWKCVLFLPVPFTKYNGISEKTKMTLLDKHGGRWPTKLRTENNRIKMKGGWKDCFKASNVKTGESIILKLIWEEDTSCVLQFYSKVKPKTK